MKYDDPQLAFQRLMDDYSRARRAERQSAPQRPINWRWALAGLATAAVAAAGMLALSQLQHGLSKPWAITLGVVSLVLLASGGIVAAIGFDGHGNEPT